MLERNGNTVTSPNPAPFKKVYLIDLEEVADGGVARKLELVDLMKLAGLHPVGCLIEICSQHLHSPVEPPSERLGRPIPEALEHLEAMERLLAVYRRAVGA